MSSSRDIERYAGLFASRTKVMKSSAMRDLMAVTARPEVISLAGGLPDTSTFPPDTFAAVAQRIASESCAKALQYGPTEGLDETKACIAEVMAAEGMRVDHEDMLVTTGGQQVLDLVTKTLIDPGDVVVAEGPTYPGAVPVFSSYQAEVVQIDMDADGMRVDLLEETLDRLERDGRRPKFIYTVPSFQNPAGVTMSQPRRHRLVEVAHERELLVLEDNPYGLLRYEGDPPSPLLSLDGGVYVMYLGTFSKILSPGIRLGWVVAPPPVLEKINLGKQADRPLHLDALAADGPGLLRRGPLARLRGVAHRDLPRAARHDARRARRPLPAAGRVDAALRRAVHLGDAAGLHRHHRPARSGAAAERGVRARARRPSWTAAAATRCDSTSRARTRTAIREGIRRIGEVVTEQVQLYGTLTGEHPAVELRRGAAAEGGADILQMPDRAERACAGY